jgi:outer membrane protein assembly factor BamB
MLRHALLGGLALALLAPLSAAPLRPIGPPPPAEGDWPQWRGPNRDGHSPDKGLLKEWPKAGPTLVWEAKGAGRGYASVVIARGKVFTMGDGPSIAADKDEYVICFDAANGKPLWKAKLGPPWNTGSALWQGSRSTPTVDGDRVYALTAQGNLVCLETATGKEVWRKNFQKDFDGRMGDGFGYSESVLIDGDKLVCTPGGDKATMAALNKKTGETLWTSAQVTNGGAGHSSIVIAEVGKTRVYVQTTVNGPLGVRASDGKLLWAHTVVKKRAVRATPLVRGDLVFCPVGQDHGGVLLRQVADGEGIKVDVVSPLKKELNVDHGGALLIGDHLYHDTDQGSAPYCVELTTGKVVWKASKTGKNSAALACADGHLYIRYADGTVVLAKASPDGYTEVSSFKIPGSSAARPSWAHPVIVGGRMYLREGDSILCYDVKAK